MALVLSVCTSSLRLGESWLGADFIAQSQRGLWEEGMLETGDRRSML